MEKTIIIYYSLEGNTRLVATAVANLLQADVLSLVPKKAYPDKGLKKFFWGGKAATMKEKPELEPYTIDFSKYDVVILATPVWAGTYTPPLRTFIEENDFSGKKLALIACSSGGSTLKCFENIKKDTGISDTIAELSLIDPKVKQNPEDAEKISEFCEVITRL